MFCALLPRIDNIVELAPESDRHTYIHIKLCFMGDEKSNGWSFLGKVKGPISYGPSVLPLNLLAHWLASHIIIMTENEVYRVPLREAFQVSSIASHAYTAGFLGGGFWERKGSISYVDDV